MVVTPFLFSLLLIDSKSIIGCLILGKSALLSANLDFLQLPFRQSACRFVVVSLKPLLAMLNASFWDVFGINEVAL